MTGKEPNMAREMRSPGFAIRSVAVAAVVLLAISGAAQALTLTWDANGTTAGQTDGAGAWGTANLW